MQPVSARYKQLSEGDIRPLTSRVLISFKKEFDEDVTFFTIGQSAIGGVDIIKGVSDVVQEWDKYKYTDFSNRILHVAWQNDTEPYASVTLPSADVVLDNSDDYFTTGSGSEVDGYVLPNRPLRILAGFGGEAIPVFSGVTSGSPVVDNDRKIVTFRALGFLNTLLRRPLDETVMMTDVRADQALEAIFNAVGISSTQLDLGVGLGIIPFLWFEKDTVIEDIIHEIVERENGRLYMTEYGVITFRNRQQYDLNSVMTFDPYTNLNDYVQRSEDDIINVVEVNGRVRRVQPQQLVYKREYASIEVPASGSAEFWVEFSDPVTSLVTPTRDGIASRFSESNAESGGTATSDITVSSVDLFSTTAKITFENGAVTSRYINSLYLHGTPAAIVEVISLRVQNDPSVENYDERILRIDNDLFQSARTARSKAITILDDYKDFGEALRIDVKGTPALQIDDTITVNYYGDTKDYKITRIQNSISMPGKFTQIIDLRHFERTFYFTIGVSAIESPDPISP